MKIALIGYGKMGKEIEKIAINRKHEVVLKIDIDNQHEFTVENLNKADVAIEFSTPKTAYSNFMKCFEAKIPVVTGTTGWLDKLDEIKQICQTKGQGFFYTSNFSLGVNIFFKLNQYLAKIMNNYPQYDLEIEETHHITKLDAPSGTAISLANDILKEVKRKSNWSLNNAESPDQLAVKAIRKENVPGLHIITYDSSVDYIQITHNAKSREGFAFGAVLAAEYMKGKKGFCSMDDLLNF